MHTIGISLEDYSSGADLNKIVVCPENACHTLRLWDRKTCPSCKKADGLALVATQFWD